MDGILNLYKPVGPTSHDMVYAVRRATRQKRVGHAGTLDPAASGVLVMALGQATRVVEYLMDHDKRYCAEITLGYSTDTYDATGTPTSAPVEVPFTEYEIATALASFVGTIEQVPPAYSAIKVAGKPLYKVARAGQATSIEPRQVQVYAIELCDWRPPKLTATIHCGKGTYIRSIAHDLGQRLGCGAHLSGLVRLASGRFTLEDSVTLPELEHAVANDYVDLVLYPLDEALIDLPAVIVSAASAQQIRQGSPWRGNQKPESHTYCRAYSENGDFLALMQQAQDSPEWRPKKVFSSGR